MTPPEQYPRWRKKPVVIDARQWTGTNEHVLRDFAGHHFAILDAQDRENSDDPEATAQILDDLHSTWVLVYTGDWIIKGIRGEFYPCRHGVFVDTYEPEETDTLC